MTGAQCKRFLELQYLILEFEVTPADRRPLTARVKIAGWRRELAKLLKLAQQEGYIEEPKP